MKKLYLAYVEITVFGTSFNDEDDAKQCAINWWTEQGEDDAEKYWDDLKILEIDVFDAVTDDDFRGCADVGEYESVAKTVINEYLDNLKELIEKWYDENDIEIEETDQQLTNRIWAAYCNEELSMVLQKDLDYFTPITQ